MPLGQLAERIQIAGMSVEIDGQDGADRAARGPVHGSPGFPAAFTGQEVGGLLGIEPPGNGVHVEEYRMGAAVRHHVDGGDEGEVGHEHLVPTLDPGGDFVSALFPIPYPQRPATLVVTVAEARRMEERLAAPLVTLHE